MHPPNPGVQGRGNARIACLPVGRREFLRRVGTVPVALAGAGAAYGASVVAETLSLPQIRLGEHSVSRLICGDNPFKANCRHLQRVQRRTRRKCRLGPPLRGVTETEPQP